MLESRHAREGGHQLPVLAPKELVGQARPRAGFTWMRRLWAQWPAISRISMRVPGVIIPYIARAISSA